MKTNSFQHLTSIVWSVEHLIDMYGECVRCNMNVILGEIVKLIELVNCPGLF